MVRLTVELPQAVPEVVPQHAFHNGRTELNYGALSARDPVSASPWLRLGYVDIATPNTTWIASLTLDIPKTMTDAPGIMLLIDRFLNSHAECGGEWQTRELTATRTLVPGRDGMMATHIPSRSCPGRYRWSGIRSGAQ
jgi:hypothetical protein